MFERFIEWLTKRQRLDKLRLNKTDYSTLQVLFEIGKIKQYDLEKALKKKGPDWTLSHSTVTSKLNRYTRDGLVFSDKGPDGFTYYEINPVALAFLVYKGKVKLQRALDYFKKRPLLYFEMLARFQPNLKDRLKGMSTFYGDQLTEDLWMIYYVANRSDLRQETLQWFLDPSQSLKKHLSLKLQVLCTNRLEIEGKGACLKEKRACEFRPGDIMKCYILRNQTQSELSKLKG